MQEEDLGVVGVHGEVLEGHVREHIAERQLSPAERQTAGEELIDILRRYLV